MMFTVLSYATRKSVGKYSALSISYQFPYDDQINYVHYAVDEGLHAEGYYLHPDNTILYDHSYTPPVNPYQIVKYGELRSKRDQVDECIMQFAAENSEILNTEVARLAGLGQLNPNNPIMLAGFVRLHLDALVDAMIPIMNDLSMLYYWRVGTLVDAIERDSVLRTDLRLNEWKNKILALVM